MSYWESLSLLGFWCRYSVFLPCLWYWDWKACGTDHVLLLPFGLTVAHTN